MQETNTSLAPTPKPSSLITRYSLLATRYSTDLRNLWLIAAGWVALLLIIPPAHEYPVIDDWIYARSVQNQVSTGAFLMPDASQANLVGLTLWGTLWVRLFGFSFTVLSASTLVMALVALIAFYCLLRVAEVSPNGALLGVTLLAANPIFFHLSYSFMTDVPFMALTLLACLCYLIGLRNENSAIRNPQSATGVGWLLAGGFFAGYAFLIRQFGLLIPLGFLLYLAIDGALTRHWRWRQIVGVAIVPALMVGGWYVWSRQFDPTFAASYAGLRAGRFLFTWDWPGVFFGRALAALPLVAFFACVAVRLRRAHLPLVATWGIIVGLGVFTVSLPDNHTFAAIGNILRVGGIDFFEYHQEPIWTPEVWRTLVVIGAALSVPILAKITSSILDFGFWILDFSRGESKIQNPKSKIGSSPLAGFYLTGALVFLVSLAFLGDLFDRYILGFIPFVIVYLLRGSKEWGRAAWVYSVGACVLLLTFSLVAKADFVDHNNARWEAARWLSARAPLPVQMGYDWNNWAQAHSTQRYEVSDLPVDNFRIERTIPYLSRLSGFTTRYVLAQSSITAQPLPEPAP